MRLDEVSLEHLGAELAHVRGPVRLLLVVACWLIFMLFAFFLSWKSDFESSQRHENSIRESLAQLDRQSLLLREGALVRAELSHLEAQLPILKTALPTQREVAIFLDKVNEVMMRNTVKLVEFTPQPPVTQEVMQVVPVKIHLKGEGESIASIPSLIAGLSRQASVKTFEMSLLPDSTLWQMTGQLNAYAQLPSNRSTP